MVIYDLICKLGHEFEGWFKNADELSRQQADGFLVCPYCDSGEITKKLTAPNVGKKSNSSNDDRNRAPSQSVAVDAAASTETHNKLQKMLAQVHHFVESNFEDVGNRFADEALSIHRGEKEASNIRGRANQEQLAELAKEGVAAIPIPPRPIDKKKLN